MALMTLPRGGAFAIEYKKFQKCFDRFGQQYKNFGQNLDEIVKYHPEWEKADMERVKLVEEFVGSPAEDPLKTKKTKDGTTEIEIAIGNIKTPWDRKKTEEMFKKVCESRHPGKAFCYSTLLKKYDRAIEWRNSLIPKLQPLIDRAEHDPKVDWPKEILALNLQELNAQKIRQSDPELHTIETRGWDETVGPSESGLIPGRVTDEKGNILWSVMTQGLHFIDTGKNVEYLTLFPGGGAEAESAFFFTGVDEREWNCYVQKQVKTRLYLNGKPAC